MSDGLPDLSMKKSGVLQRAHASEMTFNCRAVHITGRLGARVCCDRLRTLAQTLLNDADLQGMRILAPKTVEGFSTPIP